MIIKTIIGFVIGVLIAGLIPYNYSYEFHREERLVSLNQGMDIDGGFVLGSGSIDGGASFKYFEKQENGYRLGEADPEMSRIVYTDSIPTVIIKNPVKKGFGGWFGIPFHRYPQHKWIFKIPKGSVKRKYKPQDFDKNE